MTRVKSNIKLVSKSEHISSQQSNNCPKNTTFITTIVTIRCRNKKVINLYKGNLIACVEGIPLKKCHKSKKLSLTSSQNVSLKKKKKKRQVLKIVMTKIVLRTLLRKI